MKGLTFIRKTPLTALKLSKLIAKFASAKKADDIIILDMRKIVNYCDYFVICSGNTDRQVRAIADYIEDEFAKLGLTGKYRSGLKHSDWLIFDTGDIVVHIFEKRARKFYELEYLWQESKRIDWENK